MISISSLDQSAATPGAFDSRSIPAHHPTLAAIDVGTNSIHMVIVRINPQMPNFSIISREKATVRLGETTPEGNLTEVAMARAWTALDHFLAIAKTFQVEAITAVATSAVREASNGHVFLAEVERRLGLVIDLISGQEEARRIYLGVLSAIDLNHQPHVVVDIGGGSTELILGDGHEPLFLRSIKVGAVRLTQKWLCTDPPTDLEFHTLQDYVRGMVEPPIEKIKHLLESEPVRLIGTSGTIDALATLDVRFHSDPGPNRMHGYALSFTALEKMLQHLRQLTVTERAKLPGLVERRAEIIIAGAVILQEVMQLLGADQITVCERALREGLIVDWMLTHGLIEDRLRYQASVRARHVLRLAEKYHVEINYANRVAEFALSLFDQTYGILHHWGSEVRDYLWAAAILHNCGHFVSHSSHHKHSYYLIRHGELLGFNEEEVEVIANLARYHRKSPPKKKHENFQLLASDDYRRLVTEVSPFLRLATALDRRRIHAIKSIHCRFEGLEKGARRLWLDLEPTYQDDRCALELWSLESKKDVFEDQFKLELVPRLQS